MIAYEIGASHLNEGRKSDEIDPHETSCSDQECFYVMDVMTYRRWFVETNSNVD
jgi:hypothetical protein